MPRPATLPPGFNLRLAPAADPSGSSGGQPSDSRQALSPPARPVAPHLLTRVRRSGFRLPVAGLSDSRRAAPSSGVVPSTDFRPQSSAPPLALPPASFQTCVRRLDPSALPAIHFRLTARSSVGQTLRMGRLCTQVQIVDRVWILWSAFRHRCGAGFMGRFNESPGLKPRMSFGEIQWPEGHCYLPFSGG